MGPPKYTESFDDGTRRQLSKLTAKLKRAELTLSLSNDQLVDSFEDATGVIASCLGNSENELDGDDLMRLVVEYAVDSGWPHCWPSPKLPPGFLAVRSRYMHGQVARTGPIQPTRADALEYCLEKYGPIIEARLWACESEPALKNTPTAPTAPQKVESEECEQARGVESDPPLPAFARNLRRLMKEASWGVPILAMQTEQDQKNVRQHRDGKVTPGKKTKEQYAKAFSEALGRRLTPELEDRR